MLTRIIGLVSLTLWVLAAYFVIMAQYLDRTAYEYADHALITGLRVLAGGCAIPAVITGFTFLNLRDQAIMRAQRAANDAAAESPVE